MTTVYNFIGKVILITGSSSGIGATTAVHLAKAGAQVVITGRNAAKLQSVAKQCSDVSPNGVKPLEVLADISTQEGCRQLIDATVNRFSRLDVLVNNAGFGLTARITDEDYFDKYKSVFQTNLDSVILLTQLSVKHLEATKGSIINISSCAAWRASDTLSSYCMSKCALDMFTKCAAIDLGRKGIRVNSLNPGPIKSDILITMGKSQEFSDNFWAESGAKNPIGRSGEQEDIARAVMHLASDETAFITGINYVADGGYMAANVDLQIIYQDKSGLLVINQSSVDDLNSRLPTDALKTSYRNFRPNILISECDAFDEDNWQWVSIRDVEFEHLKPCDRCVLTTINPDTGIKNGVEPLQTLRSYRMATDKLKKTYGTSPLFGTQIGPKHEGEIYCGDDVLAVYK
ncbi:unnamed protein product [Oppiella nova]|uniref:MOSC domain-containing protein n=1 Tax=Oppiella nova TaxID=334625 RepID=A0A7R9LTC1_9ACAR|nr:unnamed protein product [Oppiella nova]CAG2166742.1 unnamed protein product [Oppiella nova]